MLPTISVENEKGYIYNSIGSAQFFVQIFIHSLGWYNGLGIGSTPSVSFQSMTTPCARNGRHRLATTACCRDYGADK